MSWRVLSAPWRSRPSWPSSPAGRSPAPPPSATISTLTFLCAAGQPMGERSMSPASHRPPSVWSRSASAWCSKSRTSPAWPAWPRCKKYRQIFPNDSPEYIVCEVALFPRFPGEIVSEASRRLPDIVRARQPDIPWRNIVGAENILRHDGWRISDWPCTGPERPTRPSGIPVARHSPRATIASTASAYRSSFDAPIPLISASASRLTGRTAAISRSTVS